MVARPETCFWLSKNSRIQFLSGTKSLEGKELKVKVPAGIQSQSKLRVKGHGLPAGKTGSRGDVYVKITVDVPQDLTNEQKKLIKELADKGL
jgi:curved DNA-binding protein